MWNRFLRLFPLLAFVLLVVGFQKYINGESIYDFMISVVKGVVFPTLPNGGWSITVEVHFYLVLPFLLYLLSVNRFYIAIVIVVMVAFRCMIYFLTGEVQTEAYWTIFGRIDQFVCGIMAYHFRRHIVGKHLFVSVVGMLFVGFYWFFDSWGGFYINPSYPSVNSIWIFIPLIEGVAYSIIITWYDNSFSHSNIGVSKFIGRLGEYSYSIYLLHIFFVFEMAGFIDRELMDISSFYWTFLWSLICFVLMFLPAYISFYCIEMPFLKFRCKYTI